MKIKTLLASSLFAGSALFAGTYNVDAVHSSTGFSIKHMMISTVKGNFAQFNGSFEYDEATKTLQTLSGTIQAASIDTQNDKRDEHLRSADLFDVAKYPTITFALDKIQGDKAYGKLTIKGITKPVVLAYENGGSVKDPWGNQRVGLNLSGKINRSDFGITWNKALEAGGVTVGDEVKLDVAIEGVLKK
jgi:polyisoprenoid-binding protein YceI